ncbi:MAG: aldo/keto reductase [Bryobacteraceae bacterium]|jgi:predicted aldo/keto reductase-like oxidoreductase
MASRRSFLATALSLPAVGFAAGIPDTANTKTPAPRFRVLGKTGLKVTELGFGAEGVSDVSVIRQALDLGLNFFDTAHAYQGGNNERTLGVALGADRKKVILSSRSYVKDRKMLEAELDLSLRELKTDYLDIWYLGANDRPPADELLSFQQAAKKAGKIRFAGFSTHACWKLVDFIKKANFDVVMLPYNFTMGRDQSAPSPVNGALEAMAAAGVGVVAIKVMAGGHRGPQGHTPFPSALRWTLRRPEIHTTSISMHDHDQLEENVRAAETPFSEADEKTLAAHLERIRPLYCRMCYQCDGQCPQGLPVADVLRYLMYADSYRQFDHGYQSFQALPGNVRTVRCQDCGRCSVSCPNGVAVRERLTLAQGMFA